MNYSKRSFFKKAFSGLVALSLFPSASALAQSKTEKNKLFMHVVFFWLKNPENFEAKEKFEKELKFLTENIEVIKSSHIGKPAPTDRPVIDNTYSYSLILGFKDKADQDIYQEHLVHQKFIENAKDLWEKVVVYDSEAI